MDFKEIKKQFPIFENEPDLAFLDNASTTQKPERVLRAMNEFYVRSNANIHRGVYGLAERADQIYDEARRVIAGFINAAENEVIFTKNATEGANLLAFGIGETRVSPGDNIVVTELEHHSNYLPWQEMAKRKSAELRVVRVDAKTGLLMEEDLKNMIDERTKVVAVTAMSNVLGVKPDLKKIAELTKKHGALMILDGAQSAAHDVTDVKAWECDAAFFTGHKLFGPMGTGFCFIKKDLAEEIQPMLTGGGMIKELPSDWLDSPTKFEAGTPNVAGLAGLTEAIKFIKEIGFDEIVAHEKKLTQITRDILSKFPEVKIFGISDLGSISSFSIDGVHPHDLASIFAKENICIRAGHHCAKPLLARLGEKALARISFSVYNEEKDLEKLEKAIASAIKLFK